MGFSLEMNPNPLKTFPICHLCFASATVVVIYVIINIFAVMFAVGIVTPSTLSSLPHPHFATAAHLWQSSRILHLVVIAIVVIVLLPTPHFSIAVFI